MKVRISLVLLLALLLISGSVVTAQPGNLLTYGSAVIGTIDASTPLAFYTFSGTAGDIISVQVFSLSFDFTPNVGLNSPEQQQLANSNSNPFNPGAVGNIRIDYRLPDTGIYSLLVGGGAGSGDFVLRLDGRPAAESLPLTEPVEVFIQPEAPSQIFSFAASPTDTLALSLSAPDFAFVAIIRNAAGQIVAVLSGNTGVFTALPGDEAYEVEIAGATPAAVGAVSVSLGVVGAPSPAAPAPHADVPPPVATEEVDAADVLLPAPTDVCTVGSNTNINIRSGPGTNFNTIAQLQPGQTLEVVGYHGDWYAISVPGVGQGWVRNDVVSTSGPCDNLPFIEVTGAPQIVGPTATTTPPPVDPQAPTPTITPTSPGMVQPSPTYTVTQTPPGMIQPTATYTHTPTFTPMMQATATFTPTFTPTPPIPTAPPDANFNDPLNIPIDSTASSTDFVSYPDGDREDRVRYSVTGLGQQGRGRLIITASCFGTGTQHIQFFTGGRTFGCGQTVVERDITFDSNTGTITITAVGGTNTYVQWVLTGSATRSN